MFALTFIISILPSIFFLIWRNRKKGVQTNCSFINTVLMQLLRSFDCGILLATLFLHLIPQARKNFELFFMRLSANNSKALMSVKNNLKDNFEFRGIPCVELLICLSFFTVYFCEELAQLVLKYRRYYWYKYSGAFDIINSFDVNHEFISLNYRLNKTRDYLLTCSRKTSQVTASVSNEKQTHLINEVESESQKSHINSCNKSVFSVDSLQEASLPSSVLNSDGTSIQLPSYWQDRLKSEEQLYLSHMTIASSLPVHSILEGCVIGSQENVKILWMVFSVILFHKIISTISLRVELYQRLKCTMMPLSSLIAVSFLPTIGFMGVMIINLVFKESYQKSVCVMILSALSAGTVLHITFNCIRQSVHFFASMKSGIIQHFTMYTGFILILACTAFLNTKNF